MTAPQVTWRPAQPRSGDIVWVRVGGATPPAAVDGVLGTDRLEFFRDGRTFAAVTGIDLDAPDRQRTWEIRVTEIGQRPRTVRGHLSVQRRDFPVQRLTLPPAMVNLDAETERRANEESMRLRAVFTTVTAERLWRDAFVRPVPGSEAGTGFGARRVINGQRRAPHAGLDYSAPLGTPVVAANGGRIALVGDYFFPGRLIVIDHGLGLYTLYFHLDTIAVAMGESVVRGQQIGTVGATGRATGPHLHFGVQVGVTRVDPATLQHIAG